MTSFVETGMHGHIESLPQIVGDKVLCPAIAEQRDEMMADLRALMVKHRLVSVNVNLHGNQLDVGKTTLSERMMSVEPAVSVLKGLNFLLDAGHVYIPLDATAVEAALMLMEVDKFPHTFCLQAINSKTISGDNGNRIVVSPMDSWDWTTYCGKGALDVPFFRWIQKTFREKYPKAMEKVDEIAGRFLAKGRVFPADSAS